MESPNPKFPLYCSTNECARINTLLFPSSEVSTGAVSLVCFNTNNMSNCKTPLTNYSTITSCCTCSSSSILNWKFQDFMLNSWQSTTSGSAILRLPAENISESVIHHRAKTYLQALISTTRGGAFISMPWESSHRKLFGRLAKESSSTAWNRQSTH